MLYVLFAYIIPYMFEEYDSWTQYYLKVFIVYLWSQLIANFLCVYLYDTTVQKTKDRPDIPGIDNRWDKPPERFISIHEMMGNGNVPNGNARGESGMEETYCDVCEMDIPSRAHHCKRCDKCILKRDHHCFVVGTCIGFYNQRYFVVLAFHVFILSSLTFYLTYKYINLIYYPMSNSWTDFVLPVTIYRLVRGFIPFRYALMIYHLYIEFIYGLYGLYFFTLQMSIIAKGKTMYEIAKRRTNQSAIVHSRQLCVRFWSFLAT